MKKRLTIHTNNYVYSYYENLAKDRLTSISQVCEEILHNHIKANEKTTK
jgi:hypothetical protein